MKTLTNKELKERNQLIGAINVSLDNSLDSIQKISNTFDKILKDLEDLNKRMNEESSSDYSG